MLLGRSLVGVRGYVRCQARDQLGNSPLALAELLARAPLRHGGTRDVVAFRDQGRPTFLQPVAQCDCGEAIVSIVARDDAEVGFVDELGIVELEMRFQPGERPVGVLKRGFAGIAVKGLELLDRIALDACPQPPPDDAVEVDEPPRAQQEIDFLLPARIAAHEALQRGGFIGRVMIDVQVGMRLQAADHEIDEALESGPFLVAGNRPVRNGCERAAGLGVGVAEQKLDAALADERVALEVEEHVAGRRLRKAREAEARLHRQQLEQRFSRRAPFKLDPGLLADSRIGKRGAARGLPCGRQRHRGERRDRVDALALQLLDLNLGRAGDEREMIVRSPPPIAALPPAADVAIFARIGIGRGVSADDGSRQAVADAAIISAVVVHPKSLRRVARMRRDDVGIFGAHAVRGGEKLGVEAELQDGTALGFAGELRVDDLVGPRPQSGRRLDAPQHVRPPDPVAGAESALDDDVRPGFHRRAGARKSLPVDADALDDRDGEPARLQMLDIPLFVPPPSFLQKLLERVPEFWLLERSVRDLDVQRGQMPAMQMPDEVGGAEQDGGAGLLHVMRTLTGANSGA